MVWLDCKLYPKIGNGRRPAAPEKHEMSEGKNRQWLLARRPKGQVSADDFGLNRAEVPTLGEGEILVRNIYLSCDPTQRGWMARDTYMPMIPLGEVMRSFAGGEVVLSRHPQFTPGQHVYGLFGWQDYAVAKPAKSILVLPIPDEFSIATGMSALGLTGLTA
jgi:NADPH-dependent curcumin reductase CurA